MVSKRGKLLVKKMRPHPAAPPPHPSDEGYWSRWRREFEARYLGLKYSLIAPLVPPLLALAIGGPETALWIALIVLALLMSWVSVATPVVQRDEARSEGRTRTGELERELDRYRRPRRVAKRLACLRAHVDMENMVASKGIREWEMRNAGERADLRSYADLVEGWRREAGEIMKREGKDFPIGAPGGEPTTVEEVRQRGRALIKCLDELIEQLRSAKW